MYAYFYIDKDDNLVECDRDVYKDWRASLKQTYDILFFYIKDKQVCVECPGIELYDRLEDKYGDGSAVMHSEFSVEDKCYTIVTDIWNVRRCIESDSHRGFYGYYPTFGIRAIRFFNGDRDGETARVIDCPNYGLEKAIEYHESIILDIVSGKDLKYIS